MLCCESSRLSTAVHTGLRAGGISMCEGFSVTILVHILLVTISAYLPFARLPAPKLTPSLVLLCAFQTPTKESHSWDPSQKAVTSVSQELQM